MAFRQLVIASRLFPLSILLHSVTSTPWVHLKEQRLCLFFVFLSLHPCVSGSMSVAMASQEMRCVSCKPDEPTRSVMVQPGWNINRVCLHMRVIMCAHVCVHVCMGWQAALFDIGVDPCVAGLHMAEVLFKRVGVLGVYSIWRDKAKVFFFFTLGPSVDFHSDRILHFQALMLWSIQMLMRAERRGGGFSHKLDLSMNSSLCLSWPLHCPETPTTPTRSDSRDTHTHSLFLSFTHIQLSIV